MKKPWQSKTIFINGVLGLVSFAAMFFERASSVSEFIAAHPSEIGMGWAILNIILRAVTKERLSLSE